MGAAGELNAGLLLYVCVLCFVCCLFVRSSFGWFSPPQEVSDPHESLLEPLGWRFPAVDGRYFFFADVIKNGGKSISNGRDVLIEMHASERQKFLPGCCRFLACLYVRAEEDLICSVGSGGRLLCLSSREPISPRPGGRGVLDIMRGGSRMAGAGVEYIKTCR